MVMCSCWTSLPTAFAACDGVQLLAVLTTVDDETRARELATALVERRLVACAQISRIESVYRWDGEVLNEAEYRLLLKTTKTNYTALEAAILELHPYDTPAILALSVEAAEAAFSDWVTTETG